MEHTKEPWHINDQTGSGWMDNSIYVTGDDGSNIVRCYNDYATAEANASRIVACVNACAGIQTDDLERWGISLIDKLREDEVSNAVQQRDKLLAALDGVVKRCKASGYVGQDGQYLKAINALITEVEAAK